MQSCFADINLLLFRHSRCLRLCCPLSSLFVVIQKFWYHCNMISYFSVLSVLKIMLLFWTCGVMCFAVTADHLKLLLSFAVGGLLGDVFLHLLPEAWGHVNDGNVCFFQF